MAIELTKAETKSIKPTIQRLPDRLSVNNEGRLQTEVNQLVLSIKDLARQVASLQKQMQVLTVVKATVNAAGVNTSVNLVTRD